MKVYFLIVASIGMSWAQSTRQAVRDLERIQNVTQELNASCTTCAASGNQDEGSSRLVPFLRDTPRDLCAASSGVNGQPLMMYNVSSCDDRSPRTGVILVQAPEGATNRPCRRIQINADDGARAEVFLHVEEEISPSDSHNQKSVILLIPRRSMPHTEIIGNEIHVTLPTGELVVFDRVTNNIIRGALQQGPMDLNPDRHARRPPNIQYSGTGISIRASHRYQDPRVREEAIENGRAVVIEANPTFEVKQGDRTCTVPRARIWTDDGMIRGSDESLVQAINQTCPARSGQRPFSI